MTDSHKRPGDRIFEDLMRALQIEVNHAGGDALLDHNRRQRTGIPEIILAEGKQPEQVRSIIRETLDRSSRVIVSRADNELVVLLESEFGDEFAIDHPEKTRVIRIKTPDSEVSKTGGQVAIFTAGTSDLPLANETRLIAEEMGCTVTLYADTGVAGLHRLIVPLKEAINRRTGAIVVIAGMDGALPSVISGLSPVPVIGLPSSVGYGYGGNGEAALMAMLQTCAPGLTVVNIDNSVGAGIAAARIANQAAAGDRAIDDSRAEPGRTDRGDFG